MFYCLWNLRHTAFSISWLATEKHTQPKLKIQQEKQLQYG